MQAPPGRFQLLEGLGVQDFVELIANQLINLRNTIVEHRNGIVTQDHPLVEHLDRQFPDQVPGIGALGFVADHVTFLDNLIQ